MDVPNNGFKQLAAEKLKRARLYAITDYKDAHAFDGRKIESALVAGVDIIQLRSKSLSDAALLRIGSEIRQISHRYEKLFIVNDRIDIALLLDADGVHLGQDDISILGARTLIKDNRLLIGKSTHNVEQALQAEAQGADYVGFGPIFKTPTKPTYQAVGLSQISTVKREIKIPFVCIGGIDRSNVEEVRQAGAGCIAVVRAVFDRSDIEAAVQALREKVSI